MLHATATWGEYPFTVCPPGTSWSAIPAVYIFAYLGAKGRWYAIYVGWTRDLKTGLSSHPLWKEAASRGATHIHAMNVITESDMSTIKRLLIEEFQPSLNGRGM